MVGLGFSPFQSAVLNLLANTAPVAWGAIGTPIVTLAAVSGLNEVTVSAMAGRQLPVVPVLVPFWLVTTFVLMEGGTLVAGLRRAGNDPGPTGEVADVGGIRPNPRGYRSSQAATRRPP